MDWIDLLALFASGMNGIDWRGIALLEWVG